MSARSPGPIFAAQPAALEREVNLFSSMKNCRFYFLSVAIILFFLRKMSRASQIFKKTA